jgi:hypothetical protein
MLKSLILALLLAASFAFAAEEAPKLPVAVQVALDKAYATVTTNRKAYDSANAKAFEATEKALKSELDRLTKAGNLEAAMAVKKIIDGFKNEIVAKVDKEVGEKKELIGGASQNENMPFVGEWKTPWNTLVIRADGTASLDALACTWKLNDGILTLNNPQNDTYDTKDAAKTKTMMGRGGNGKTWIATKIK